MDEPQNITILSKSEVFNLDQLAVRTLPNGGKSWQVVRGRLATGETIAVHVSRQPAELPPNPPHTIAHSEFVFIQDGTLEFQFDGKSERVNTGGVVFVAPGTMHSAKNVGSGPVSYFVISIGGDTR